MRFCQFSDSFSRYLNTLFCSRTLWFRPRNRFLLRSLLLEIDHLSPLPLSLSAVIRSFSIIYVTCRRLLVANTRQILYTGLARGTHTLAACTVMISFPIYYCHLGVYMEYFLIRSRRADTQDEVYDLSSFCLISCVCNSILRIKYV